MQAALPTYLPELQKRSSQEVTELVGHWKQWLHPRADNFFRLDRVLTKIAKHVSKGNDPVTSGVDDCIFWHGDVSDENGGYEGVIDIDRDGQVQKQTVFINRLLLFLFATEDSFEQLMKLPKAPFRMACPRDRNTLRETSENVETPWNLPRAPTTPRKNPAYIHTRTPYAEARKQSPSSLGD